MSFEHPWWLLLLVAVPLYLYFQWKSKHNQNFKIGFPVIEKSWFQANWKVWFHRLLPWIKAAALSFFIIALARPQERFQRQKLSSEGIDIVLSVDLSLSMLAKDFEPDRLSVAKRVIQKFIKERPTDRIGLTVFAGESYTVSPPTLDHNVLLNFVQDLQYGQLKDGTAIGMGLSTSINRLKDSNAASKIIILVTDGSNNYGVVDPKDAAEMAKTLGIKVYTIGVGSNGTALMPIGIVRQNFTYRNVPVVIDEALLKEISDKTSGAYYRATNSAELEAIYDKINTLEKSEFDSTTLIRKEERFHVFLSIGFVLFLIQFVASYTIFRNIHQA